MEPSLVFLMKSPPNSSCVVADNSYLKVFRHFITRMTTTTISKHAATTDTTASTVVFSLDLAAEGMFGSGDVSTSKKKSSLNKIKVIINFHNYVSATV